ncbi:MAG TPA: S8 family serine peptidase, partial [Pyrinomonadaceae bacterium]|nr:S8 family serine peptidase [Pyrinomonadaceae bacterium]
MYKTRVPRTLSWLTIFSLLLSFGVGSGVRADSQSSPAGNPPVKLKISPSLLSRMSRTANRQERVRVIVQLSGTPGAQLNSLLRSVTVRSKRDFSSFNTMSLELPLSAVGRLASFPEVKVVSVDQHVRGSGHVVTTTGASLVGTIRGLKGKGTLTVDGTGIGIAVLDSGIYADHLALTDAAGGERTVSSQDFTGENRTDDPYGHGTHVASAAAGNDRASGHSTAIYTGIAPNATVVSLRVLNGQGVGSTSTVLAALDWVMKNGSRYKIRVVNMSLGTPAVDSYLDDPLCQAVRKLVDNGIVVVAAAGNDGKDNVPGYGSNTKVYGRIHSPGNEPSAITVGATNTFGTDVRSDDAIATYSSRGPTRSYRTDAAGVKHYDNVIKPELVAPGNKIIYAESPNNYLVTHYPQL